MSAWVYCGRRRIGGPLQRELSVEVIVGCENAFGRGHVWRGGIRAVPCAPHAHRGARSAEQSDGEVATAVIVVARCTDRRMCAWLRPRPCMRAPTGAAVERAADATTVSDFAASSAVSGCQLAAIALAVSEAVSNAVIHALSATTSL